MINNYIIMDSKNNEILEQYSSSIEPNFIENLITTIEHIVYEFADERNLKIDTLIMCINCNRKKYRVRFNNNEFFITINNRDVEIDNIRDYIKSRF